MQPCCPLRAPQTPPPVPPGYKRGRPRCTSRVRKGSDPVCTRGVRICTRVGMEGVAAPVSIRGSRRARRDDSVDLRRARLLEGMTPRGVREGLRRRDGDRRRPPRARQPRHLLRAVRLQGGVLPRGLPRTASTCWSSRVDSPSRTRPTGAPGSRPGSPPTWTRSPTEPLFALLHARGQRRRVHARGQRRRPRAQAERDAALHRFAKRYGASFEAAAARTRSCACPAPEVLFVLAAGVDQLSAPTCAPTAPPAFATCCPPSRTPR